MESVESLVKTVKTGERPPGQKLAAFGEIVRRFQDMAYGCAYAILGDFHLAEDAAQEAFIAAYRGLHDLREPKAFGGWLRRIVLTQCSRMTRGRTIRTAPLDAAASVASDEPQPPEALEKRDMRDKVLAAVRALPEPQRMATTLFYINGYTTAEIAEFLEVPVTTVKKRLVTSRNRLKERMMKMVDETMKSFPLPDDFADVVVRRAASEEDLKRAAELLSYQGRKHPEQFASPDAAERAGIYVVGETDRVEGAGYFNETELGVGSTVLRAVRPYEMGGEAEGVPDPAFVRSFRGCFKLAREHGLHLAVVHGSMFDHAFCGFVPCFYYPVVTLPVAAAKRIVTHATMEKADDEQAERARLAYLRDPYVPKMSAFIGGGVPHAVTEDGEVTGYARVVRNYVPAEHFMMPFGHVCDVTVQTREAALAVIRLAAELGEKVGDEEVCFMQSHMTMLTQTMLSLGGTYVLRKSCDQAGLDAEMVAIIDLAGLTRDLQGEFQSRLESSPVGDAAFSMEMAGMTVGFVVRSGRLDIVDKKQKVHRKLPRWIVTRLVMGYYSGDDVLTMGPLPWDRSDGKTPDDPKLDNRPLELPHREAALFRALFPKLWPTSLPDPDVWPWVIGKPHPKYQGEEHKTPEMKAQIDALRFPWMGC